MFAIRQSLADLTPFSTLDLSVIQNNSLSPITQTMTDLEYKRYYIEKNYPEDPNLMWCAYDEESDYGRNLTRGDNGRAYGHWQIHLAIHNISYDCAMNFECSTDWTIKMWRNGYASLWTGYTSCK